MAVQIPSTLKPSMSLSAKRMISAFITNKNNPREMMVTGNVKMMRSGFTKTFRIDKTTATNSDVR